MAQYCVMCGQVTNCTENCKQCLAEEQELMQELGLTQNKPEEEL